MIYSYVLRHYSHKTCKKFNLFECYSVITYIITVSFSAGVGRTGTFITLDAMMERLMEKEVLNIFEFVTEMRTRRKQMVQTMVST